MNRRAGRLLARSRRLRQRREAELRAGHPRVEALRRRGGAAARRRFGSEKGEGGMGRVLPVVFRYARARARAHTHTHTHTQAVDEAGISGGGHFSRRLRATWRRVRETIGNRILYSIPHFVCTLRILDAMYCRRTGRGRRGATF